MSEKHKNSEIIGFKFHNKLNQNKLQKQKPIIGENCGNSPMMCLFSHLTFTQHLVNYSLHESHY